MRGIHYNYTDCAKFMFQQHFSHCNSQREWVCNLTGTVFLVTVRQCLCKSSLQIKILLRKKRDRWIFWGMELHDLKVNKGFGIGLIVDAGSCPPSSIPSSLFSWNVFLFSAVCKLNRKGNILWDSQTIHIPEGATWFFRFTFFFHCEFVVGFALRVEESLLRWAGLCAVKQTASTLFLNVYCVFSFVLTPFYLGNNFWGELLSTQFWRCQERDD